MALQHDGGIVAYSQIGCLVVACATFGLRVMIRVRQKRPLMDSDWVVLAALGTFAVYVGVTLAAVYNPVGTVETDKVPEYLLPGLFKLLFAVEITIGLTIVLSKISLLLFLRSLFITPWFRKLDYALMGLCVIWYIVTTLALFFQCRPVAAAWDVTLLTDAHCTPLGKIIAGYEVSNVVIDLLIIALPINEVRKLNTSLPRKIGICFLFVLGGFVIVTSVLRILHMNINLKKLGAAEIVPMTDTFLWTTIQLACSILCACLPTLAPLLPGPVRKRALDVSTWLAGFFSPVRSTLRATRTRTWVGRSEHMTDVKSSSRRDEPELYKGNEGVSAAYVDVECDVANVTPVYGSDCSHIYVTQDFETKSVPRSASEETMV